MSFFNFFSQSKINDQLRASSSKISSSIKEIFTHKTLDNSALERLEEVLITSDIGSEVSAKIINNFRHQKFAKNSDEQEIKKILAIEIYKILAQCQKSMMLDDSIKPRIVVFNGINGVGKTTTIGKIAYNLSRQNKQLAIAACDTFRAAASDQLAVWAKRANCQIISALKEGEDAASVAYRAVDFAKKNNIDILLIDTAGRLQNKGYLMDELKKINSVIKKIDSTAPHENLLILDATIGQNAKNQLEVFDKIIGVTGLIITKLDGSAKGGIVVALADKFQKPIYAIGIGEKIEDLQEFNADAFAKNLVDLK
jgi:fused signal recognition particle receptor